MSGLFGRKEGSCACARLASLTCSCSSNNTINTRGGVSSAPSNAKPPRNQYGLNRSKGGGWVVHRPTARKVHQHAYCTTPHHTTIKHTHTIFIHWTEKPTLLANTWFYLEHVCHNGWRLFTQWDSGAYGESLGINLYIGNLYTLGMGFSIDAKLYYTCSEKKRRHSIILK